MKFKCPECGKVIKRDMRIRGNRINLTPTGRYPAWCPETTRKVFMLPVVKGEK